MSTRESGDDLVAVRLDSLAPGGDAVGPQLGGSADGRATFVPLGAPGERVRVRIVKQKARVAWAEIASVDEPSRARVTPPCPFFGRCGGCQWQHVDLAAQREAKRAIVARALDLRDIALMAPVADGRGTRDRVRVAVGARGAIGFRARRSHDIVDVDACLLLAPALGDVVTAVRASSARFPPGTEIDLQAGREGVHASLRVSAAARVSNAATWLDSWRAAGVVGVRVAAPDGVTAAGAADVDVAEPGSPSLRVPAGGFAQVGATANAALVAAVLDAVGAAPGAVLELYAGSGNFTRHLIDRATRVVACDTDAAAVARGRAQHPRAVWSTRPPRGTRTSANVSAAGETARHAAADDASVAAPDTVVVDPPRDGLDAENLAAAATARRRLVYVSCDPQTLGRDVARLAAEGLALRSAVALDLMPHTFHVEVVAIFERI